jgi:methionine synthase II (cobalamin-independent)
VDADPPRNRVEREGAVGKSQTHDTEPDRISVQVDDPDLTYFCDETFLSALREDGFEPDVLLSTYLQAHSDATKNCPEGLVMGIHLRRGNFSDDLWLTKGGYENIARRLFTETGYDAFFLEYKTEKTGSLEPLRFLPKGMTIVLGLVSTKQAP